MVQNETAAYWLAANEGRLLVKRCTACGQHHHYPRDICPFCLSDATEWCPASGEAVLYAFSSMGQGDAAYTMAMVTLSEGVSMMSNVVGVQPSALHIGQKLRVVFVPASNGQAVPMFTPA